MKNKRLILVTGMPRSGTTAVGDVLGTARGAAILHEPLNYLVGLRDVPHYFVLPGGGEVTNDTLDQWVSDMQSLSLHYKPGLFPKEKGLRRLVKQVVGGRSVNSYRRCLWTPGIDTLIWKDPFAALSARYLHEHYKMPVVVMLRNPWAVAASFKRMRWAFDLDEIMSRIQQAGQPHFRLNDKAWKLRHEPAANAALLWFIIYSSLHAQLAPEGGLIGLSLDELIQDPATVYAELFDLLGLPWTESVKRGVLKRYLGKQSEPRVPIGEKAHDRKRDLASMNQYWRKLLSADEQALVSAVCEELWESLAGLRMVN